MKTMPILYTISFSAVFWENISIFSDDKGLFEYDLFDNLYISIK